MRSMAVKKGVVQAGKVLSADDRTLDYLKQIYEAGTALAEIDNISHLLERVAKIAVVMGRCEGCSILSSNGRSLEFLASLNIGMDGEAGAMQYFSNIVLPINSKTIVGHCAITKKSLSIDDVYEIPPDAGYSYNSKWDEENNYRCESILSIPMLDSKQNLLGVLELINHISGEDIAPFPKEMEDYLRVLANQVGIVLKNLQQAEELRRSRFETVMQFVKACEYRDHDLHGHIERIGEYSAVIYRKLGYTEEECNVIRLAAMLHDVGKISIPDAILKKPGILTPEERVVMQGHARAGHDMLTGAESPMLKMGAIIALMHHEKWDGTGYPHKIAGKDIPVEGRIVAIVDVFDALSCKRCYKDAWPIEKVYDIIREDSGKHFDPELVELLFNSREEFEVVREKYPPNV
jgi:HD-GYP domain-containing protein (c-di-GMP phosphodiesterase class II)